MGPDYGGIEKRRFLRVSDSLVGKYSGERSKNIAMKIGGLEIDSRLVDLSEGGMAVFSRYLIPRATLPLLRFHLLAQEITAEGSVVHKDMIKGGGYRLGIRFEGMSAQSRTTISNFVKLVFNRERADQGNAGGAAEKEGLI